MHTNMVALESVSRSWNSEFEGILLIRDKKMNYSEHWCKLKGNILVFCKTADKKCDELYGIVILEYFTIESIKDINNSHLFRLVFEAGDSPMTLVAKSREEYLSWKQHIAEARCNSYTQRLHPLKEEVYQLKKKIIDKEGDQNMEDFIDEDASSGDKSGLEITLSCQNLPHYSIDTYPNPLISVFLCNSVTKEEKLHSTTDNVQDSSNPEFHKIIFISESYYETNILVKFIVYDIRDVASNTRHKIGKAEVFINTLLNNSNLMMNLKNDYNSPINSILRLQVQEHRSQKVNDETQPEIRIYKQITENNLLKSYCFMDKMKKDLKVVEMMGESIFGFRVASDYLKKLFEEESLLQESLSRTGWSDTLKEKLRTDRLIAMKNDMHKYELLLSFMSQACAEERKFHPSSKKSEFQASFIPVNLHINRIYVVDDKADQTDKHLDVISVGVFSAHHLKFKNGGLLSMAKNLPEGLNPNSKLFITNAMLRQYVHFVQDISNQIKHIQSFISYPNDIKEDLVHLETKIERLFKFFQHDYLNNITQDIIRRDYQQLITRMKDFTVAEPRTIKLIKACADKFEQSLEDIGCNTVNALWSNIFSELNSDSLNLDWSQFIFRENIAFSQTLTAVVTGLSLACNSWTSNQWSQMIICGVPIYFEGLLSSYGDENGMLEDMAWVLDKLLNFIVIIKPNIKAPSFNLTNINRIEITCYPDSWKRAPVEVKMKHKVKLHLHPYFFNVGINEQQTFADKMSKSAFIQTINMCGLKSMRAYFSRHSKTIANPIQTCKGVEIFDRLNDLEFEIEKNKNKNVKILRICQHISWAWGAIRFTSCKSAKDRTGMALSLEQVRWLKNIGGMNDEYFSKALDCIRSTGLRRNNCYKNSKVNKFAFNAFQLLSFPKNYRPPVGTYGSGET